MVCADKTGTLTENGMRVSDLSTFTADDAASVLAQMAGFGPALWLAIGLFTLLSATNDIAIDGYTIEIPEGTFYVAEACAGLRFLIASIAFGCLYALLMYRSPVRRTAFIVISIVVPIIEAISWRDSSIGITRPFGDS